MVSTPSPPRDDPAPARVLIVDDEAVFARAVSKRLRRAGLECEVAGTLGDAAAALARNPPDLMLLDMRLPDGSGLDFLARLRAGDSARIPVMILTAFGDLHDAVAAMKQRAVDYLTKPIDLEALVVKVERALEQSLLERRLEYSRERESHAVDTGDMLGTSAAMAALRAQMHRLQSLVRSDGAVPPTVLILGETGTGKDLCARSMHLGSARAHAPFVHLDCASLPKDLIEAELFGHEKGAFTGAHAARSGLIEAAESGTLFLNEIGELPLDVQSRLLAVLERRKLRRIGETRERPVAAWFIAATNRNLQQMVDEGRFRSDLYFRLNVLTIELPPLASRREDVPLLAEHYIARTARRFGLPVPGLDAGARAALERYHWPGNVRELINVVERAVLLSDAPQITSTALGLESASPSGAEHTPATGNLTLGQAERRIITDALRSSAGNVSRAARMLGITRMALRYRLQKHGIDPKSFT